MDRREPKKSTVRQQMFAMLENKAVFRQAQKYAGEYLDGLLDRAVFPPPESIHGLTVFDEPLPEAPGEPTEILAILHEKGSPATVTHAGGRYFGFVNGGAVPVAVAAKWLSTVWDQNPAL